MKLLNLDPVRFLHDYWQKEELLIRNPWNSWRNPLTPDELAGLACEEEVESRLIIEEANEWELEQGPFPEARFASLPPKGWTLLVQAVDHYVPAVAALIEPFRFIPNWRIDDIMVSYAADQGSAGPHFDQYDVFLIQGLGRRRWQVGRRCDDTSEMLPHEDLRLLANFEPQREWVLEAGDILYLPPGLAHHGVAVGNDCMTYSIGFRAPCASELIAHWSEHLLMGMEDDERYADRKLKIQDNPGEIRADAIAELHGIVAKRMLDQQAFARWFGEYSSTPKYAEADWRPEAPPEMDDLRDRINGGVAVERSPASRFSFLRQEGDLVLLFVDGRSFECSRETATLAERLCADVCFDLDPHLSVSEDALAIIAALVDQGSISLAGKRKKGD
jgi:50S ribosomal protein L16 3-hydroxylase